MTTENAPALMGTAKPFLLVGYDGLAVFAFDGLLAPGSMIFIEEPEVVRKRRIREITANFPLVRDVIEWEHILPGKADEFFHTHRDLDPAAVLPMTEYATPFAARLSERFGLPGASLGAALVMRDKELLRRVSGAAGVRNPEMAPVDGPADVLAFMKEHPGTIVVKPANRQASVGTEVIHDPAEVDEAWLRCIDHDERNLIPSRERDSALRMLAEHFVTGPEFSVETLVRGGEQLFSNVTGKKLYSGARPVELAHIVPADISPELTALLQEQTLRVIEAAGFQDGIVHCEWIVEDGVPYLVECAGRRAGDGIIDLIQRAYPVELNRAYLEVLSGTPVTVELPTHAKGGSAIRFLDGVKPGVVTEIRGVEAAQASEGVFYANVQYELDDQFDGVRSSIDRPGFAATQAGSPAEAIRWAEAAAALIEIDTRPVDASAPAVEAS
jgi:biotin carboxylase